jgi:hypothetical protein
LESGLGFLNDGIPIRSMTAFRTGYRNCCWVPKITSDNFNVLDTGVAIRRAFNGAMYLDLSSDSKHYLHTLFMNLEVVILLKIAEFLCFVVFTVEKHATFFFKTKIRFFQFPSIVERVHEFMVHGFMKHQSN